MKKLVLSVSLLSTSLIFSACSQSPKDVGNQVQSSVAAKNIIGGTTVSDSDTVSHMIVSLYNKKLRALCSGSLVSDSTIISAAHCVEGVAAGQGAAAPEDLVIFFANDVNSPNRILRSVSKYRRNPRWYKDQNAEKDTGDLSIVHFDGGLPPGYQPATMLTDASVLQTGATVTLAGYGINTGTPPAGSNGGAGVLRQVDVTIKSSDWDRTEVLMDQTNGKGACHGDSGGPAYITVNGQLQLFGVTSRGVEDPNNACNVEAAYTNIVPYAAWIAREIKALNNPKAKPVVGPAAAEAEAEGQPQVD